VLPEFDEDGDLPVGIHEATLAEIEERFGRFTVSDRRVRLLVRLRQIAELAWSSGTNRHALRRGVKGADYDVAVVRAGTTKAQEVLEFFQLNRNGKKIGIVEVERLWPSKTGSN